MPLRVIVPLMIVIYGLAALLSAIVIVLTLNGDHENDMLAFTVINQTGQNEIQIADVDHGFARPVEVIGTGQLVAWSPDGHEVAFVTGVGTNRVLYLIDIADGTRRQMTDSNADDSSFVWSPDSRQIAFVSNRTPADVPGNPVDPNAGSDSLLTTASIARRRIYVMDNSGENVRMVSQYGARDNSLAWSPDGRYIAFTAYVYRNNDVHVIDLQTGETLKLTTGNLYNSEPQWSADSTRIAFVSGRDQKIYIAHMENKTITPLTSNSTAEITPVWSSDSELLAYAANLSGNYEIYLQDMSISDAPPINLSNHPAEDFAPVWSPDGTQIAFVSDRENVQRIYVMNSDGSRIRTVQDIRGRNATSPLWRP